MSMNKTIFENNFFFSNDFFSGQNLLENFKYALSNIPKFIHNFNLNDNNLPVRIQFQKTNTPQNTS